MRYIYIVLSLLLVASTPRDPYKALTDRYESAQLGILCDYKAYEIKVRQAYSKVLADQMFDVKKQGALDDYLILKKEHKLVTSSNIIFKGSSHLPVNAQKQYAYYENKHTEAVALKQKKLDNLKKAYAVELNKLIPVYVKKDMIDKATAIKKLVVKLTPLVKPKVVTKADMHQATIYANAADTFVMHLNGVRILTGSGNSVYKTTLQLQPKDVIAVRVWGNSGGIRGFSCVIIFKNSGKVYTSGRNWKQYSPTSVRKWYLDEHIKVEKRATVGNSTLYNAKIKEATGQKCKSIWGRKERSIVCMLLRIKQI